MSLNHLILVILRYPNGKEKDSPQKVDLREMMGFFMKENNIKIEDGTDINFIMRDMMSIILEGALDNELDEELGYSKYDYRNKNTDNGGTATPKRRCIPVMGTWRKRSSPCTPKA